MFYLPNETKIAKFTKHLVFWIGLCVMFGIFLMIFNEDVAIPQKEITLKVDIKNKVNICLPEDENIFEESSFFGF